MVSALDCGRRSGLVVAYITASNRQIDAARQVKGAATACEKAQAAALLARARELRRQARKRLLTHRQRHGC
jgi:hypothetical protein